MASQSTEMCLYILDRDIPLHDPEYYKNEKFGKHDIAIPIVVLDKINRLKKVKGGISADADEFSSNLTQFEPSELFNGGAERGSGLGRIRIISASEYHVEVQALFADSHQTDNAIVNVVYDAKKQDATQKKKYAKVILVSNDANTRLKAGALGIDTEEYDFVDSPYSGFQVITGIPEDVIDNLHKGHKPHKWDGVEYGGLLANQFVELRSESNSVIGRYLNKVFTKIDSNNLASFGIKPKNREQKFAMDALLDPTIDLVTIQGEAGVGKTLLALAAAFGQVKQYDQIFYTRQTVALGDRDIGFLPGGTQEKVNPFMQAMDDNIRAIQLLTSEKHKKTIDNMRENGKIVIEPVSFIRGRSLLKKFFIVDEAQNFTLKELKAIVTRAGEGTKVVLLGDPGQTDLSYLSAKSNGFSLLIDAFKDQQIYAHITLGQGERSRLANLATRLL